MAQHYLIIADDFTGSNDTGVHIRKRGLPVDVILYPENGWASGHSMVLDTESRNIPAAEAHDKVAKLAGAVLKDESFDLIYKKVDSTLRGNIVQELQAILELYKADRVVFAPAFPKIGRTTLNGIQRLKDVPLMETEMAHDPVSPIKTDSIISLMESGMSEAVIHHGLTEIRGRNFHLGSGRLHTFDATETTDLLEISRAVQATGGKTLWVGSAGLAEAIFEQVLPQRPVLAIVGSVSATSQEQMNVAEQHGIHVVQPVLRDLLVNSRIDSYADAVLGELNDGRDIILTVTRSREDFENSKAVGDAFQMDPQQVAIQIQTYLGQLTEMVLQRTSVAGLFLTGGDTSLAVIRQLQASGCAIQREVLTGIVQSRLTGGTYDGLPIITKAGAFGAPDDLYFCLDKLKEVLL